MTITTTITRRARIDGLLEAIDALHDLVQSEAETAERLNRPTPATQRALTDSGIFRSLLSEELGGYDANPSETLEIIERISYVDPSIGWLVRVIASETANVANHLPRAVLHELSGDDHLLVAGQAAVVGGTAIPDADGYRFTGSWRYAPGLAMATHVVLCVTIDGTDEVLLGVVGREQLRIQDNWNVLGLRASASFDYDADDLFVPARFTFRPHTPERVVTGVSSRLGPALMSGLHQGAWSQGVGRRMLDELRHLALLRLDSGDDYLVSDEFYAEFARHYSHVKGTMALLRETWTANERTLRDGDDLSDEQETMSRLAASLSTRTVLEISQLLHRFAGAQVMRNGTVQRLFRDAHAGTQHRATAHVVTQECGRMIIGAVPEGAHWGLFDLVVPETA